MRTITRLGIACSATFLLAACGKSDRPSVDTAAASAAAPATEAAPAAAAPAPVLSLSDIAGRWKARSVPVAGTDTSPTNYVLTTTADTTGWSLTFDSGLKVPLRVMTAGDSLMLRSGMYASPRRKGMQVWTESNWRRQGDRLVGTVIAHYTTTGPDSVLRLRSEAMRMP